MPDEPPPTTPAPTPAASPQAEGQRFFRHYVLVRPLGRGPLGSAWLVNHEGIGREMAMRFLPDGWVRDEKVIAALQGAVRQSLEITHRGIVSVQDFVNDGTTAAIVTKYVDADTLHEVKSRHSERCFSLVDIQPWLSQVAEALDFAWNQHSAVHGDLNPHNLLITRTNEVRIADFGLARSLFGVDGPDGAPLIVGTLAYISPERVRGAMVAATDDVYGFGATVYELLTGRAPFFRGNILWQLSSVVPPGIGERRSEFGIEAEPIPPEWEEVIAACLAKRPEDRPRHIREACERLGLLVPLPPAVETPPTPAVHSKPAEPPPPKFIPPPTPKTAPVIEYPSSLVTADMIADGDIEPVTMAGQSVADLQAAVEQEKAALAPTANPAVDPTPDELEMTALASALPLSPALADTKPPAPAPPPAPVAKAEPLRVAPALEKTKPPPLPAEEIKPPEPAPAPIPALEKTKPPEAAPAAPSPAEVKTSPAPPLPVEVKSPVPAPAPPAVEKPKVAPARPAPAAIAEAKAPAPVAALNPVAAVPPPLPAAPAPVLATKRPLSWPIWIGGGAAAVAALSLGFWASRRGGDKPPAPTPAPTPVAIASPTPAKATPNTPAPPPPTPVPPPTLEVRQLAALADRGPQTERRMLIGKFKVVSAQPPREASQRVNVIVRPVDPAFTGNVRIMASFPPGTRVTEDTMLTWTAANEAVVRKVDGASDGVNVTVEAAR